MAADLEFRPLGADEGDGAVVIAAMIDEFRGPYSTLWRTPPPVATYFGEQRL